MAEMMIKRTQERVSNRYLGATSQTRVWNSKRKMWCWVSLWNFQVCNAAAVYIENPPPGSESITLTALTPTGRYPEELENINLKHWGVK